MRKIFLLIIAPLLSLAIILATGLGLWYFGNTSTTQQSGITGEVTVNDDIGDLTVNGLKSYSFTMTVDQPKEFGGTDGLSIGNNVVAKYIQPNQKNNPKNVKFRCQITLPRIRSYKPGDPSFITFPLFMVETPTSKGPNDIVYNFKQNNNLGSVDTIVFDYETIINENDTFEFILDSRYFVYDHKYLPSNEEDYNKLVEMLKTAKVIISFSISYV